MAKKTTLISDDIKKAAAALRKRRPLYKTMIDFYEHIFILQEEAKNQINLDPIQIPKEMLSVKRKEKFPLITISDFVIDARVSETLLKKICQITKDAEVEMNVAAKKIFNVIASKKLDPKPFFSGLLDGNEALFAETAADLGIDKKVLAFVIYSSIKPSLSVCAEQLAAYLKEPDHWQKGYCPICGNPPGLSMLDGEGKRFLICSFCWHQWSTKRMNCPFCDTLNSKILDYFFSEEEQEYRVYTCKSCKNYLKTVDTRKADRVIYPPLEQVSTLHLDLKANEMGFNTGVQMSI
jgi:FdhE protein